jgi:energy-converting hydrogenase Eha subunit C
VQKTASDRSFGLLLGGFCLIIAAIGYWSSGRISALWTALAAIFLAIFVLIPRVCLPS